VVVFAVPPMEMAAAEACEHKACIDQESRASHLNTPSSSDPRTLTQICNMGSLSDWGILKKSLMIAMVQNIGENRSTFGAGS
jgi:hypothetical protein